MAYISFQPSDYFNATLYSGSASTQSVNIGYDLTTDGGMVWLKPRNAADHHRLLDTVRGKDSTLSPNQSAAAGDNNNFNAFTSTGFELLSGDPGWNNSGTNYVSWNWVGGAGNDTGTSNTDGTITSTVSANTTAGFSICTYTGDGGASSTFGHGLGAKPDVVIYKQTSGTENWLVTTDVIDGSNDYGYLNTTASFAAASSAVPTSSVVNLTASGLYNSNGSTYVAYCFASKKGFSKFGNYTGNGNDDGPFLYTGFRPAFVMIKSHTGGTGQWLMFDNKRNDFNVVNKFIKADDSAAEGTSATANKVDFCSNGIKIRENNGDLNLSSSVQYLYMAFAESPLVSSNDIPGVAR